MKKQLHALAALLFFAGGSSFAQCSFTTAITVTGGATTGCGNRTLSSGTSGNTWTQKANYGGGTRQFAVGFSIGSKGYLGTGSSTSNTYTNDFWEYDPTTNAWTQKANFAGTARYGAVGFSIGAKGYVGTGYDGSYKNDFWEFDPVTNFWTQRANFSGTARYTAVGFNINSKGYVGTGYGFGNMQDFWEYDPSTNFWTQKASFAGSPRYSATGFSIGNKGYLGSGYTSSNGSNDFWEYDPALNTWVQKASLGIPVYGAASFAMNGKGYIATGFEPAFGNSDKLYQFDPIANTWTQGANMGAANVRQGAVAFAIGQKGYVGTGNYNNAINTFWEYEGNGTYLWSNGATTQSITISSAGTYSVLLTSAGGCTATASQVLAISPNPTLSVSGSAIACAGTSNTLVASGAGTYTWSANAGSANTESVIVSPTLPTTYTVSGTTGTCTVNYPVAVNVSALPVATIAASGPTLGCGTLTLNTNAGGNTWTQKAGLNIGRYLAFSMNIGSKGYIGAGYNNNSSPYMYMDFWEYDATTNAWTQKANYGGGQRQSAFAFSIGNKGYAGAGYSNSGYMNDFWEYDPTANTWVQKASFIGAGREQAVAFSIGSKGYAGTGTNNNNNNIYADFWEYDPASNTWSQKTSLSMGRTGASAFSIGSKGYIGTGNSSFGYLNDFWEYDPTVNTWTQKTAYPGGGTYSGSGFAIGSKGYLGTGYLITNTLTTAFYEFDPALNTWTQKANLGGVSRQMSSAFVIGAKGYLGMGYSNNSPYYMNDLWQYDPSTTITWSNGATTPSIAVSASGLYSVSITNASGCSASAATSVSLSPNPTLSVSGGTNVLCGGLSSTLVASGASTYIWSANSGGGNATSVIVTPAVSTIYTLSGTTGTCTVNLPVAVNVIPTPVATIAVSGPTLGCGTLTLSTNAGGNMWTQKAGLNVGRQWAIGFSIGNKGYMGTGYNNNNNPVILSDFWEYDPTINAWTQKANYGGGARYGAASFVIGSKGYVGTGLNGTYNSTNDFWEFDPVANTWTQKTNFAGTVRTLATGFSIAGKGYIGTGQTLNYPYSSTDLWEYDPATNAWTQKTNFPGLSRYGAVSLSIGSKGYLGTGQSSLYGYTADFYEYNPSTNAWTIKATYPDGAMAGGAAFAINGRGYVATGITNSNSYNTSFYEYEPVSNVWTIKANFAGIARNYATAFAIGNTGYLGLGNVLNLPTFMNDFWQYEANTSIAWSTGATVQAIPVSASGSYSVTVSNAAGCSASASQSVALSPNPTISVSGGTTTLCSGTSNTLVASGASTYTWSANAGGGNASSVVVSPASSIIYTVSGTTGSCTVNYPVNLNVAASPVASIAASGPTLGCGTLTLSTNSGGNAWTQKAGLNWGRQYGVGFSIGNKGYIGAGHNNNNGYLDDFWEYDPTTNAWTQRANFGGGYRDEAVGFAIGNKGYIGTGYNSSTGNYTNDFWEFDPATNIWLQKANHPGGIRHKAFGFGIGSKGYLGLGYNNSNSVLNDFYEYDPATNTWTVKANATTGRADGASFVIGTKGYIGLGRSTSVSYATDLYEYDPSGNAWTLKAAYPGGGNRGATGFAIGNKGYFGVGYNISLGQTPGFYEYDPATNTWVQKINFGGTERDGAIGFAIGNKGYISAGYSNNNLQNFMNDLWQYEPGNTITWSTGSTLQAIPVSASGSYSIAVTNAAGCSASASQSVALSPNPTISVSGGTNVLCSGSSNTLVASGASTYTWSANSGGGNSSSVIVSPASSITYTVSGTTGTCTVNYPVTLNVAALPVATIAVSGPTLGCGILTLSTTAGGNTWTQKAGLNSGRSNAVAFAIGSKGYIGTGQNGTSGIMSDFWEYDPAADTWTQRANFGGGFRSNAVGFVIGGNGYIGTGYNSSTGNNTNDLWEFDPAANTWVQKANYPGGTRYMAFGFGIGNKGYLGLGYNSSSSFTSDFYEYDPTTNTWTAKANATVARADGASFVIGTKGYIGTGRSSLSNYASDFYEYDPSSNAWTQKTAFPAGGVQNSTGFTIGNKGYIAAGNNISLGPNSLLYEYDATTNAWTQKATFGGNPRESAVAFSIGSKGYLGMGATASAATYLNDLWQYDPSITIAWSTGATVSAIPVSNSGSYSVTVINPFGCSASASQSVALSPNPTISVSGSTNTLCSGLSSTLIASGASTYTWSTNSGGGNTTSVIVTPTTGTTYTVSGTTGTCTVDFPVVVNVIALPVANITAVGPTTICGTAITLSTTAGISNVWVQKTGLNLARAYAVGFSIGSKGYIGTGLASGFNQEDFWEYDPATNAWTQKANVGGGLRYGAVGFSIGNKGYVGTGYDAVAGWKNDFWEYDPATNFWTQRANFAGTARRYAAGFSIGTKGYLGTGNDGTAKSDFWEYDPSTNFWTQKASLNNTRYFSIGASANGKGYIGGGTTSFSYDFWEYDPNTNFWTQRANIGASTSPRVGAISFAIGGRVYVIGGNISTDTWEYNPATNLWASKATFGGSYRNYGVGFAINGKGYAGTGVGSVNYNDVWEYNADTPVLWSNGATTPSISATSSGTYSVTLTNLSGCSSTATQVISITPTPTVTVSGPAAICNGSTVNLSAGGAASYSWSANAGSATTNTVDVAPVTTTTYTVVGATNGCTASAVKAVTVNAIPVVTANTTTNSVCHGFNITLSGGGATTYTWTSGAVNNSPFIPAATSDYTVTGTSAGNCTNSAVVSVTVKPSPTVTVNSGAVCIGQAFTIIPNGALSYTYSSGTNVITPGTTASYSVTGSNAIGCTNAIPAISTVTVNPLPVITANSGVVCIGSSYTITPSGANSYTYTGGSNVVSPVNTSTYGVTGTSTAGCVSANQTMVTVTVSALPTITVSGGTVCNGQSFTLTPTGAVSYTYLPGGSAVVSPNTNTSYSVSGANVNGCVSAAPAIANVTVLVSPTISVNSGSICAGQSFTFNPTGAPTYSYSGGNAAIVSPVATSIYTVTGYNANGCFNAALTTATVTVNAIPVITANSGILCAGGAYTITPSGAATYSYSGGSNVVSPAVTSTYAIAGTSSAGCISSASAIITVTVSSLPVVSVSSGSTCSGNSFSLNPSGALVYTVTPGGATVVSPNTTTSYSVIGANADGCLSAAQATGQVIVFTTPTVSLPANAVICPGNSYTMTPAGAASYTYSGGSNVVTPASATTYTIIGASAQGCYGVPAVITVSVQSTLTVNITGPTITCQGQAVTLMGNGASTYTWSNGTVDYSISVTPSSGTTYSVSAGSGNCSGSDAHSVGVNPAPVLTVLSTSSLLCIGDAATLTATGANQYAWNDGTTFASIVISPGVNTTYTLTGAGSNGCMNSVVVTQNVTDCSVGLHNAGAKATANIHVYPNPNTGFVTIESEAFPENATIELYNYIGQLISTQKVTGNSTHLNFENTANGIYTLRVISNTKPVFVTKVVKQ